MSTEQSALPSQVVAKVLDAVVAITSDLDLDVVLRHIVAGAMGLTNAKYGALGVLEGNRLGRFIPLGLEDQEVEAVPHWPRGEGLLGEIIRNPEPIRVDAIEDDPRSAGFPKGHPVMRTFLGVPVRVREKVFGNLYLSDKRGGGPFTAEDEAAVVALAAAAGAAIDNARLYAKAKQIGVLEDRDRIARDMHDVVIQRLFASAMSLMSVLPKVRDEETRTRIEETVSDLDLTIQQIRSTIFALHTATDPEAPSISERLVEAAHAATTTLGFAPLVAIADATRNATVSADVADQLVVVLGEALTNVARHAEATSVLVTLEVVNDTATLVVQDDGIGIQPGGRRSGIRNLSIRAQERGGSCTVSALPEGGTRLEWSVPAT